MTDEPEEMIYPGDPRHSCDICSGRDKTSAHIVECPPERLVDGPGFLKMIEERGGTVEPMGGGGSIWSIGESDLRGLTDEEKAQLEDPTYAERLADSMKTIAGHKIETHGQSNFNHRTGVHTTIHVTKEDGVEKRVETMTDIRTGEVLKP